MAEDFSKVTNNEFFENCSSTHFKSIKLKHTWTIHNFSLCCERTGQYIISPTFSAGTNSDKLEWYFELFPKGKSKKCNKHVSLYLYLDKCNVNGILASCKVGIVNAQGSRVTIINESARFELGDSWGWQNFVEQNFLFNKKNKCLFDDKFTIFCEITAKIDDNRNISETTQSDLAVDLKFLLENKDFSDVTLSAGEKEFPAHKAILTARSPVLRSMFQHAGKKNRNNRVKITDMDEKCLCEVLRYVYTGKVNKLEEMAPNLLGIAKKYKMNDLTVMCENATFKSL